MEVWIVEQIESGTLGRQLYHGVFSSKEQADGWVAENKHDLIDGYFEISCDKVDSPQLL